MATFVLIHGAWHGGWCWRKVVPHLEAAGHTVIAPDLPSHGDDPTPAAEVTLDDYVRRVCEILDAQDEPVVLVGHSMGGLLVYLYLGRNGDAPVGRAVTLCAPSGLGHMLPNMTRPLLKHPARGVRSVLDSMSGLKLDSISKTRGPLGLSLIHI